MDVSIYETCHVAWRSLKPTALRILLFWQGTVSVAMLLEPHLEVQTSVHNRSQSQIAGDQRSQLLNIDTSITRILWKERFSVSDRNSRSLRNDNKISWQSNLHFQNFIVVAFPTQNSIFGRFSSLPPRPPPSKFIVVSPSLKSMAIADFGLSDRYPIALRSSTETLQPIARSELFCNHNHDRNFDRAIRCKIGQLGEDLFWDQKRVLCCRDCMSLGVSDSGWRLKEWIWCPWAQA